MKRIAVVLLAVCVMVSMAVAQEVTSVNVVGDQRITIHADGYAMTAVPFWEIDGANLINDVMGDQLTAAAFPWDADQILFFDGATQGYIRNWKSTEGWKIGLNPSTEAFDPGRGFFVLAQQPVEQTLTVLGEVEADNVVTQQIYAGFNMIAYPFAASVAVTNTALDSSAFAAALPWDADELIKWDPVGQGYLRYWKSTEGWKQGLTLVPDLAINQGEACWFKRQTAQGGFEWVETRPYDI